MSGQGKDATIAARVPHELRTELEAKRDELRAAGVHYPDGREADLSYVIRVGLRSYLDLGVARAGAMPPADLTAVSRETLGRLDGRPRAHHDGPETARIAAALAWPAAETARRKVLEAIAKAGVDGRTSDELVVELRMFSAQRRLHDLKRGGWVRPKMGLALDTKGGVVRTAKPVRRLTRHKRPADVYVLTAAAEAALDREGRLAA